MKTSNATVMAMENSNVVKFDVVKSVAEAIELVATASKLSNALGDTIIEIQKKIAMIVTEGGWNLHPIEKILQAMLDTPCLRSHGKRILSNLDFIIGYYADMKIEDNGTILVVPCEDPRRLIDVVFMDKALVLNWIISPKKIGEALHGRNKQAAFYAACTRRAEAINRFPCAKIKIDLGEPTEDESQRVLRAMAKNFKNLAKKHANLTNGKAWGTLDALLTVAADLGLIEYKSNKPQDQRNLANTSNHKGEPRIPTK